MIFTKAKVSPKWTVNKEDIKKIAVDTARFFSVPLLMYLAQLTGTLNNNNVLVAADFIPSLVTIGAIQGWGLGILVNFFLKFSNEKK